MSKNFKEWEIVVVSWLMKLTVYWYHDHKTKSKLIFGYRNSLSKPSFLFYFHIWFIGIESPGLYIFLKTVLQN